MKDVENKKVLSHLDSNGSCIICAIWDVHQREVSLGVALFYHIFYGQASSKANAAEFSYECILEAEVQFIR